LKEDRNAKNVMTAATTLLTVLFAVAGVVVHGSWLIGKIKSITVAKESTMLISRAASPQASH
jgi:hypothetical protein